MKLNDIIYFDKEYETAVDFCNENNLMIVEIEADEKGRRFQIVEVPKRTEKEIIEDKISELKQKLSNYDYIGIKIATGRATIEEYSKQIEEMKTWTSEINQLEEELKELEQ